MSRLDPVIARPVASVLETNKVLRNTYALLSLTLLFSAACAGVSLALDLPHPGLLITLVGYFGLLFLIGRFRNTALGVLFVFALTGFMGLTLGPILNAYLGRFANGGEIVVLALTGTGLTFLSLSAYALFSRRDFGFLQGLLFAGVWVAFLAGLAAYFFAIPALGLAVSSMFIVLMAGLILFQTSEIVNGGETNYLMATVALYVSIYNLFVSLLNVLGIFGED